MDCVKIGQLIFALRKDKGYTQQQLADLLWQALDASSRSGGFISASA
jgi:DNA-binding XRE family transcriptional regulator